MTVRSMLFWGEEVTTLYTPFTSTQWVSLFQFCYGLVMSAYLQRHSSAAAVIAPSTGQTPAAA